jgi:bifunctional UDP-N-acetylglucosamine pyrophosphorylase/glucosamine-1-phosphate N-acetyltransferase
VLLLAACRLPLPSALAAWERWLSGCSFDDEDVASFELASLAVARLGPAVGDGAEVGPFSYLRPGTRLGADGKLGAFVETKNASIGTGTKVPHLTYVGDADIGEYSNIGASSVFVNYDGENKSRTTIGSHVRTGSDTMFVAPVQVGDGAYTGAGTVLREDVPPGALAVSSGTQRNIEDWVLHNRADSDSAKAATAAKAKPPAPRIDPDQG